MAKIFVDGEIVELTAEEEAAFEASRAALSIPTVSGYQRAIQSMIDQTAISKQFNDGVTMASYVSSTVELWAQQAQAFVAWRDDVWQYAYSELAKVEGGVRPQPAVEEFLLELPEIVWPA